MEKGKRFPPLFIDERFRSREDYTIPKSGRGDEEEKKTIRNRALHGGFIKRQLGNAWKKAAASRKAVGAVTSKGLYLEFEIDPNSELPISRLDSSGWQLRNVRVEQRDNEERRIATVFVPLAKRQKLIEKVDQYLGKDTGKGKPRNQALVEAVDDIRAVVLESFWTHGVRELPAEHPEWVEVWLHDPTNHRVDDPGSDSPVVAEFRALLPEFGIVEQEDEAVLAFPERSVVLVQANRSQLERLASVSDTLAEIRPAATLVSTVVGLKRQEQAEFIAELRERLVVEEDPQIAVCILDGGVNRGHPVLEPFLAQDDCHAVKPKWGTSDTHRLGHGTAMAGIAVLGDVLKALESGELIPVGHCLESSKLLPPPPDENPKRLWGDYTAQAISRAEFKKREDRVFVMAVTSDEDVDRGKPSSWSGMVDQVVSGALDNRQRLFIICSGNTEEQALLRDYPDGLRISSVQNPAQAWNALTVGGYTEKVDFDASRVAGEMEVVAESGSLSPYSSTSFAWDHQWPIKPEIVLEAGNALRDATMVSNEEDLSVLTTEAQFQKEGYFRGFHGTSPAAAYASWMAAKILTAHPKTWPETVRGLIVHSAEWTPAMKAQFLHEETKTHYAWMSRLCGYGVPDLERALECPASSLVLIAEAKLKPFGLSEKDPSRKVTKDMHVHELPWPKQELLNLGETSVQMRITLSYFVEPSPGEIGWKSRYRYASHGLRFEINRPGEPRERFEKRVNRMKLGEHEEKPKGSASEYWTLGSKARDKGSIHSDIWMGSAADLADSNLIGIYPVVGWWKDRSHLGRWHREARYSLIVSIKTPEMEEPVDIYTPVAQQIGIDVPVQI